MSAIRSFQQTLTPLNLPVATAGIFAPVIPDDVNVEALPETTQNGNPARLFAQTPRLSRSVVLFSDHPRAGQRGSSELAAYSEQLLEAQYKSASRWIVMEHLIGFELLATILRDDRFSFDERNRMADSLDRQGTVTAAIIGRTFGLASISEPGRRLTQLQFRRIKALLPDLLSALEGLENFSSLSIDRRWIMFMTKHSLPGRTYDVPKDLVVGKNFPDRRLIQNMLERSSFAFGKYPRFTYWSLLGANGAVRDLRSWEANERYVIVKEKDHHYGFGIYVVMPEKDVPRHKRRNIIRGEI